MELCPQQLVDMAIEVPNFTGISPGGARPWWRRLLGGEYLGLCLLVAVTLALHFAIINSPPEPLFDEIHYVPDARSIIAGNGTLRPEHPPLAKLFIVSGMRLFGDNPLGWRFFSVIFGTISLILFYFICRRLAMSPRASLLATFLLALDDMTFVQASVAMLDVYSLTFMLAAFLLYLKGGYIASGVSVALSALAKLFGVLAFIAIGLHWVFTGRPRPQWFLASLVLSGVFFFLFMIMFDFFVWGKVLNPLNQVSYMLSAGSSLTFHTVTHEAASRPWTWVLYPLIMAYWYVPHYMVAISFTIWALLIPAAVYMFFKARRGDNASIFGLAWFAGTYLVWIPLSFITDRISFLYYFYPTVGAICVGLGLGLSQLMDFIKSSPLPRRRRLGGLVPTYLALHVVVFLILAPLTSWVRFF